MKSSVFVKDGLINYPESLGVGLKDGAYTIEIYKSDDKTKEQMGLYRGKVVPTLMKHTGYGASECDSIFKIKFLEVETLNHIGKVYHILPSLGGLNKKQFSKFLDDSIKYLVSLGLNMQGCV